MDLCFRRHRSRSRDRKKSRSRSRERKRRVRSRSRSRSRHRHRSRSRSRTRSRSRYVLTSADAWWQWVECSVECSDIKEYWGSVYAISDYKPFLFKFIKRLFIIFTFFSLSWVLSFLP